MSKSATLEQLNGMDGIESVTATCPTCGCPIRVKLTFGAIIPNLCDCKRKKLHEHDAEMDEAQLRLTIRANRCGIRDKESWDWTFSRDNGSQPKLALCKKYADQWKRMKAENVGLFLFGRAGRGKSYAAACIANAVVDQGGTVLMDKLSEMVQRAGKPWESLDYARSLNKYDLLVLDDYGAERDTEYMREQVFNIIDARYKSNKPMIVTSNLDWTELQDSEDIYTSRIASRLMAMCQPVSFAGDDLRQQKNAEGRKTLTDILRGEV